MDELTTFFPAANIQWMKPVGVGFKPAWVGSLSPDKSLKAGRILIPKVTPGTTSPRRKLSSWHEHKALKEHFVNVVV